MVESRMMKSIDYQTDDQSDSGQNEVEILRLIDLAVTQCFNNNMRRSDHSEYKPNIVIYVGASEFNILAKTLAGLPELISSSRGSIEYRGCEVVSVNQGHHLAIFCTNPAGLK